MIRIFLLAMAALVAGACENPVDGTPNALPARYGARDVVPSEGGMSPGDAADGADRSDVAGGGRADGAEVGEDGGAWPAAFRLECLEIRRIGAAGPDAFQTNLYDRQWSQDILDGKLNLMPFITAVDTQAGTAELRMASGIGRDPTALCVEPATLGDPQAGTWQAGAGSNDVFVDAGDVERCGPLAPGAGEAGDGEGSATLAFQLPVEVAIYLYEQEHDGTTLNTRVDGGSPDALPLHGVRTSMTLAPDGSRVAGALHGCLRRTEAERLCSCLGACVNTDPSDRWSTGPCTGAPRGSVPLLDLLNGVDTSEPCSTEVGEPAYDVDVRFRASRLPLVPDVCR